jgi:hypothetical protein
MATLVARGMSQAEVGRIFDRDRDTVARQIKTAREFLTGKADQYARLHLEAAGIAASKGDARPSEWALDRLGVVEPPRVQGSAGGVQVQIGVLLPGLPGSTVSAAVSDPGRLLGGSGGGVPVSDGEVVG